MMDNHSDQIVGLAGDWHGTTRWASSALHSFHQAGIQSVYHVGDFGLWPGVHGSLYLQQLEDSCRIWDMNLYVTPGNHEDWDTLDSLFSLGEGPQQVTPHIFFVPRGWRWTVQGRSFVSLGGAPSIDYEYRTSGEDWWLTETITDADVDKVVADGHADVMLAHDAPSGGTAAVERVVNNNPFGFSAEARAYAQIGRERMSRAFSGVRPKLFVHGHYHVYDEISRKSNARDGVWAHRILSLDKENTPGNAAILDLRTLRTERISVRW